jgi:hypothetical protein
MNTDHIILKVQQGYKEYKDDGRRFNVTQELIRTLKEEMNLKVYGYAFIEGLSPSREGKLAAGIKKKLGLDGIVFDVEGKFDERRNAVHNTHLLLDYYRAVDPEGSLAYCGWAKPDKHRPTVIAAFFREGDGCSVFAPMEYYPAKKGWDLAEVAVDYMTDSYERYANHVLPLLDGRTYPFSPVLRAAFGDGGWTNPQGIEASYRFCRQEKNTVGGAYWSLDFLSKYGRNKYENSLYFGWYDAVARQPRWNEPLPEPKVVAQG